MIEHLLLQPKTPDTDFFREYTETLTNRQNVIFALFCAESVFHPNGNKEARTCLDLVRKWLIDENSVTRDEFKEAAASARATTVVFIADAAYTAYYTARTAYYVITGSSAGATVATYAADTAIDTDPNVTDKIFAFLSMLLKVKIPQTPYTDPLEILVYLTDIMDFPILVQEDDKFRLNLWHKDYKFQVCGKIQDIAEFCEKNFVLGE